MSYFITRVELHYANVNDYQRLHVAMGRHDFTRVVSVDGVQRQLPNAEYYHSDNSTGQAILDKAKTAVSSTGKTAAILVSHVSDGVAYGLAAA